MTHRTLAIAVGLSAAVAWSTPSFIAQERVDPDINAKIRKEATGNSRSSTPCTTSRTCMGRGSPVRPT